jgi:predicted ATP-dependent protease
MRIESLSELIGLTSTLQLEPEPMPLDVKVVLIGERLTYYLLAELRSRVSRIVQDQCRPR